MNHQSNINPASGLPMLPESTYGTDVAGNPYGFTNPWSCATPQWDWEC